MTGVQTCALPIWLGSRAFPRAEEPHTKFSPGDPPAHLEAQETGAAPPFTRVRLPRLVRSGRKPSSLGLANERWRRPDRELLRRPALRPSSSNAPLSPGPPPATGSGAPPISLHLYTPRLWRGRRRPRYVSMHARALSITIQAQRYVSVLCYLDK